MRLEEMAAFFDARADEYDAHMLRNIAGATEFYAFTAALLPRGDALVLDLGCGTGLELDAYFALAPDARAVCVYLSRDMTDRLLQKHPGRRVEVVIGSYFDIPLGENRFDGAVSVESLHHFPSERKRALYPRIMRALKPGCAYIETDYMASSDADEARGFAQNARLRAQQGVPEGRLCHFDTPLTAAHTLRLLREAGFSKVETLRTWENTACIRAVK